MPPAPNPAPPPPGPVLVSALGQPSTPTGQLVGKRINLELAYAASFTNGNGAVHTLRVQIEVTVIPPLQVLGAIRASIYAYFREGPGAAWSPNADLLKMAILGERASSASAEFSEPTCGDLPGDTTTTGRLVVDGAGAEGQHASARDADWYAVELDAGVDYQFVVDAPPVYLLKIHDDQGTELRTSAIAPVGGPQNYYQLPNRVNSLPFRTDQAGAYYVSIASPKGGHAPDRVYTLSARSDDHPADTSTEGVAELEEPTRVYLMRTSSDPDDTATGQKGPVCQPLTTEGNNVTFEGQLRSVRWTMAWALSPTAPSICPIQRLQATSARSAKTSSPACKRPVVGHWPSGTGRESTPAGASSSRPLRTAQTTSSCFEWTPTLS